VFIVSAILLFVASKFFFIGAVFAVSALVGWVCIPLGKFIHYLATSGELARVRMRAVLSTVITVLVIIIAIGTIPAADRVRCQGIVEPVAMSFVHTETEGFVETICIPSGQKVRAGDELLRTSNPDLQARYRKLLASRRELVARRNMAQSERDFAAADAHREQLLALDEQITWAREQIDALTIRAPIAGTWISPEVDHLKGVYVERGQKIGFVASVDDLIVRATIGQDAAGVVIREDYRRVEIRLRGRPDLQLTGQIEQVFPAGKKELFSPALSVSAGGEVQTVPTSERGMEAAEAYFEIRIAPDRTGDVPLLSGQRVVVRMDMPEKPLAFQWARSLRQLIQQRFRI